MFFVGGRTARPMGTSKLNAETQVFRPGFSATGIRSFREIAQRNVVPGVDLRGYFEGGKPRYDLIVAPGAKPSSIALGFRGSNGLSLAKGALKIGTNFGGIFNAKPVAYQVVGGKHVPVAAAWTVAQGTARFKLGAYDSRRPLVIDPLVYGTYFGGQEGPDDVRAAVTDNFNGTNNGLFIVGSSSAPDYPGTSRPFTDTLNPEGTDAFVARIDTAGTATDLSVLIGGQGTDVAQYVKVNPLNGDLWIAGTTISGNGRTNGSFNTFPSTLNSGSTTARRIIGTDAANAVNFFVGRFRHIGTQLSFGVDTGTETNGLPGRYAVVFGTGIANAAIGTAYMTGFDIRPLASGVVQMAISGVSDSAISTGLIATPPGVTAGSQTGYTQPGHRAGFLLRFQADVSGAVAPAATFNVNAYSSQYVVGTRANELRGVALDATGNAYVVGTVYDGSPSNIDTAQSPTTFFTTPNAIADTNGTTILGRILRGTDVFVRIYGNYGSLVGQGNITFSGLIGGNGDDEAGGAAASLSAISDPNTGFESLIPIYTGSAIAIDADDNIYVTGTTNIGPNFPHTAGAFGGFSPPPGAQLRQSDVFVARLSTGGKRLDYAATLNAFASITPVGYGQANFTTAAPAGITVDGRGYVYVTGNLRPYDIVFPNTYTTLSTVFEVTSSLQSTIPVGQAANTIDTTYDFPSSGSFPSTEAFLAVLNPSFSSLQFASYIGGKLDDLVYAPSLDSDGNVIVCGWSDGGRVYDPPFRTTADYFEFDGTLIPLFISSNAVKNVPDTNAGFLFYPEPTVPLYPPGGDGTGTFQPTTGFGYSIWGTEDSAYAPDQRILPGVRTPTTTVPPPPLGEITLGRDGFVARVGVNLPAIVLPSIGLSFSPSPIAALGTTTGTVTLSVAQPLKTVVTITGPTLTGLAASDITISGLTQTGTSTYTLTIPSGSTTGTFTVKSNTVGSGGTVGFTASIPSGTSTATASGNFTIAGVTTSLALSPVTVTGVSSGTTVTGTITTSTMAPTALNFVVTVPNTAANRALFNVGTGTPFATVDATDATKLDLTTAIVATGSATGTFTFQVGSPTTPVVLIVTASTVANGVVQSISASATLTVNPVGLVSVTPKSTTIRGGRDQLILTVAFNGPVSSNDAFTLAYSLGGVFPPTTTASPTLNLTVGSLSFVGTSNGQYLYTYTANSNRVSRSQDITILATYKGTTASTTVTVVR